MENENPKYLLYFSLNGIVKYDDSEFKTIRKFVNNILTTRYYHLDLQIQFNHEIINYEGIKKDLSDNIMVLIGQIDDQLVDDVVYEITCVLGVEKVIRRRSVHDFNRTGYSDEELNKMYNQYLEESNFNLQEINQEDQDFKILVEDFTFVNLILLKEKNHQDFSKLFVENAKHYDCFEMLQDFNVLEALFKNFKYFIKYLQVIDIDEIALYYGKDLIKILRSIRSYVKQSEEYNDDIKELFIYKYLLTNKLNIQAFLFDPEESLQTIRNEIEKKIDARNKKLVLEFINRVQLYNQSYHVLSIGDVQTKAFQQYKKIAHTITKHFDTLKPLLKAFRTIEDNFVRFNSKMNNLDRYRITLERLKKSRIVKEYQEKYGLFTIALESSEHIPFLQGRWFEYYCASVCEDIIQNYISQGFRANYKIYQNIVLEFDKTKRELDIIIHLNGVIYYIENKIESKNTYKGDLDKYHDNSNHLNVSPNNSYLVYLDGEDRNAEGIKICDLKTFVSKFKKEVLRNLEEQKHKDNALIIEQQKQEKHKEQVSKLLNKEKESLYFRYYLDEDKEEKKLDQLIQSYNKEISKLNLPKKSKFFEEVLNFIELSKNHQLKKAFLTYQNKYQQEYLHKITVEPDIEFFNKMLDDLSHLDKGKVLVPGYARLYCLIGDVKSFFEIGNSNLNSKLMILSDYGDRIDDYYIILSTILSTNLLFTLENLHLLFINYLSSLQAKLINDKMIAVKFAQDVVEYYENAKMLIARGVRNSVLTLSKESDFISVLLAVFMKKHFPNFSYSGVVLKDIKSMIVRTMMNKYTYQASLQDTNFGQQLLKYDPQKAYYIEEMLVDVSSYIYLNYHVLKEDINKMINCDKHLIFTVNRTEQIGKMLRLLSEVGIINGYKEIKKADVYVGIFANQEKYQWLKTFSWLGTYLGFKLKTSFLYTNVILGDKFLVAGKILKNKLLLIFGKTIKDEFKIYQFESKTLDISNIKDSDYQSDIYKIKEITEEVKI